MRRFPIKKMPRFNFVLIQRLLFRWSIILMLAAGSITTILFTVAYLCGMDDIVGRHGFALVWIAIFVCIGVGVLLAIPVTRMVIKPIQDLNNAIEKVADGDFDVKMNIKKGPREIVDILESFNRMVYELRENEMFKRDFINNFSHEFKTPIVSIRGFAKQLENDDGLDEERRKEYISIIAAEAERLSNMSNNVLLLSKLENQQDMSNESEISLDEQLRRCIILLEKQWSVKNLNLNIELEKINYTCDDEMLCQMWINLISNAIKFTNEGGIISVSCKKTDKGIKVSIADTGIGMDKATMERAFERFYQADTSRATRGNGLGLPLVKRIAELCGAEITVDSQKGVGTTFEVILPLEG